MQRGPILLLAVAAWAACSSRKVNIDYDRAADFSKYKTFAWHEADNSLAQEDPLSHDRIMAAVDRQLGAKGFQKVDSNPEVYVTYHGEEKEQTTLDTTHMGYGYADDWYWDGGGMGGMGSSTTTVRSYQVGTLIVDLWDAQTKKLIWRGVGSDTLSDNPQNNAQKIDKVTEDMFKRYPPSSD